MSQTKVAGSFYRSYIILNLKLGGVVMTLQKIALLSLEEIEQKVNKNYLREYKEWIKDNDPYAIYYYIN